MLQTPSSHPTPAPLQVTSGADHIARPARPHTWHAALALFFLAPMVGEMLSGSKPPAMFLNPLSLVFNTGLYGSGALLVRELARRRGLGWSRILLLGVAYGILEEGLTITSWFNPYWPDVRSLGSYGRALDTNWVWAVGLTVYHAVFSITAAIVLAEALFPRLAPLPWLGRRAARLVAGWLALVCVAMLLLFGFLGFAKLGYRHPPLMWLPALWLAVALTTWAVTARPRPPHAVSARRPPRLWTLRAFALMATIAFFATQWVAPAVIPIAALDVWAIAALVALVAALLTSWSRRPGWGMEHRLALAAGVCAFLLLLAPLDEFANHAAGKDFRGMTLAALLWLAFLICLSHRIGRLSRTGITRR